MNEEVIVHTTDGVPIFYSHRRAGFLRLIVIAPGFYNSHACRLLQTLADELNGYDVIVLDFRGHGRSGGRFFWTSKEYLDLLAVLTRVAGDYERIGVIGFSLGAATSLIAAAKTDLIHSVAAVSCPTEFKKIEYHLWELNFEIDIRYNIFGSGRRGKGVRPGPFWLPKDKPMEIVKALKQPVLYLHGTNDWIIKPWHSQALYDRTESIKRLEIISGGFHAEYLILKHQIQTVSAIRSWFEQTL